MFYGFRKVGLKSVYINFKSLSKLQDDDLVTIILVRSLKFVSM